jgi:hypothetical protein
MLIVGIAAEPVDGVRRKYRDAAGGETLLQLAGVRLDE